MISCVIPFYNEGSRIKSVLTAIKNVEQVDEIILVDDGSTDGSSNLFTEDSRIKYFRLEKNHGKAAAIRYGVLKASGEILMFLDADLKGVKADDIRMLIHPVISGEVSVSISQREYLSYFDVVSGERVIKRNEWEDFFCFDKSEFNALEISMNRYILLKNLSVKAVKWPDVKQEYKSGKIGFINGITKDISAVNNWMKQMGKFNFSVTYLFFWIMLLGYNSRSLIKVYQSMYRDLYKP